MTPSSILALAMVGLTLLGVAAGAYPGLKMNRATIALVGAVALVALGLMAPAAAVQAIDPNTILLLFAMMVISAHLRLAGFFDWVSQWLAGRTRSPRVLLAFVILATGVLAALVLNDAVVVAFTPLVLQLTARLKRNPLPYLMGVATAANIGSTATLTGNPQNILIGQSSGIPFAYFLLVLGPLALVGLAVAYGIILFLYRPEFQQPWPAPTEAVSARVDVWAMRKCLVVIGLMLIGFLLGAPIALAAIIAAAALLVTRRTEPEAVFGLVDWSLLVFFAGLFVVTGALDATHVTTQLFNWLGPAARTGVAPLAVITAALSNLISNVPAVLLFRPIVPGLPNPQRAWLTLAMASTLAGNLTLLGSVANLIVAETAGRQGVKLTFREYLRAGVPITLATLALGILWLSFVS